MSLLTKICDFIVNHSNMKRGIQGPPGSMGAMGVGVQSIDNITIMRKSDGQVFQIILRDNYGEKICGDIKVIDITL